MLVAVADKLLGAGNCSRSSAWPLLLRITTMAVRLSSADSYATLLDKYDTWMFDCDGVLWHGDRLIDGAIEVLHFLRQKSASALILGNSKSRRY
jgi:hypothetical protein